MNIGIQTYYMYIRGHILQQKILYTVFVVNMPTLGLSSIAL